MSGRGARRKETQIDTAVCTQRDPCEIQVTDEMFIYLVNYEDESPKMHAKMINVKVYRLMHTGFYSTYCTLVTAHSVVTVLHTL